MWLWQINYHLKSFQLHTHLSALQNISFCLLTNPSNGYILPTKQVGNNFGKGGAAMLHRRSAEMDTMGSMCMVSWFCMQKTACFSGADDMRC